MRKIVDKFKRYLNDENPCRLALYADNNLEAISLYCMLICCMAISILVFTVAVGGSLCWNMIQSIIPKGE